MSEESGKKEKSEAIKRYERETKIKRIHERLHELKEYKRILAEDGLHPDADDKKLESELIIQLLRLEKGLPAKAKPKDKKSRREKMQAKAERQEVVNEDEVSDDEDETPKRIRNTGRRGASRIRTAEPTRGPARPTARTASKAPPARAAAPSRSTDKPAAKSPARPQAKKIGKKSKPQGKKPAPRPNKSRR